MKNTYNPKQYWKNKIGFNSNEELLIYQYLCGTIKRKNLRQLDTTKKFHEYKAWRNHVEKTFINCENDNLLEFYHFIKLNSRSCNSIKEIYTHFAMPLIVSIVAGGFINSILSSSTLVQQSSFLGQFILFIISCFLIIMFFIIITYIFMHFFKDYINSKNEIFFWKDYLEIVEIEINKRNLKT